MGRKDTREWFRGLTVPVGVWGVLRLDGCGFSRLTSGHFGKPFDTRFAEAMVDTARELAEEFGARYVYTVSDEISILLEPGSGLYGRRVEKLVSVSAGMASARFTAEAGVGGYFDSRIWIGASIDEVGDYFAGRQADAARTALHGWCYWTLRQQGLSGRQATEELTGKSVSEKNELLYGYGINFNKLPAWQRRGVGIWRDETAGGQAGLRARKDRFRVEWELPMRAAYRELVVRQCGRREKTRQAGHGSGGTG